MENFIDLETHVHALSIQQNETKSIARDCVTISHLTHLAGCLLVQVSR